MKTYEVQFTHKEYLRLKKIKAKNRTEVKKIIKKKYHGAEIYDILDYPY